MKKILVIMLILVAGNISAQQEQRKQIVDSLINGLTVVKDIQYNKTGRPLLLDIYYPKNNGKQKLPCVVWIHGGGLTNPNLTKDYDIVRWGAASTALNGFVSVSVDYRLVTETPLPGAIEDCFTAIRYLKQNAKKYNIDPKRIGVVGESSGGYLSSFMIFAGDTKIFSTGDWKKQSNKVDCGVIWYGYTKHPGTKFNVLDYISKNDPPSLLIHGREDKIVKLEESVKIKTTCEGKGLNTSLIVIDNADHGYFDTSGNFGDYRKHMEEALKQTIGFFKEQLK